MANSILEQANALASNGGNRINERSSLAEVERLQQEANNAASLAQSKQKRHQAVAQYHASGAEQDKIQGQNLLQQGSAKMMIGGALMAMGGVLMAMAAIPSMGPAMIAKGMAMIGQGLSQLIMGSVDMAQGRQAIARFLEKLELATKHHLISKDEQKIVRKEMTRSRIYEMKKQLLEDLMETLKPMLDQMGLDGTEMNEDQLTKWFDKMFEKGAEMLVNNGLLETDLTDINGQAMFTDEQGNEMRGNHYFMRDDASGDIFSIEVARDTNGNPLTDALGGPLLNMNGGSKEVVEGELKEYLEAHFMMVRFAESIAMSAGLDPHDLNEANEFADLVHKTNITAIREGRLEAPVKIIFEGTEMFFQEWDYENDIPIGPKTPANELAGGDFDRGDIESYQLGMERAEAAMEVLGFNGGNRFNLLMSTTSYGLSPARDKGFLGGVSGRESEAFQNFSDISTTLDIARAQRDILAGSNSDDTGDSRA